MKTAVVPAAAVPVVAQNVTARSLIQIAVERGAGLDELTKLMELQERHDANEARKAYNVAFAAFKAETIIILRNKEVTDGPLKGKSYAELFSIVDAVSPPLSRHGLSHSWKLTKDEKDWIEVTCTLKHALGHSESATMGGPPDAGGAKNAIQARASTVTYLEKYTLKAVCGVSERGDDKDGAGNGGANGLDEQKIADLIAKIRATKDDDALTETFKECYQVASEAKDKEAQKILINTKDLHRKTLRAGTK